MFVVSFSYHHLLLANLFQFCIMQAVYFNYYGDLPKALEHFLKCKSWQKAHSIFVTSVAHKLFLSGEYPCYVK